MTSNDIIHLVNNQDLEGLQARLAKSSYKELTKRTPSGLTIVNETRNKLDFTSEKAIEIFRAVITATIYYALMEYDLDTAQEIFTTDQACIDLNAKFKGTTIKTLILTTHRKMKKLTKQNDSRIAPKLYNEFLRNYEIIQELKLLINPRCC